jgi:hypothetical protein
MMTLTINPDQELLPGKDAGTDLMIIKNSIS